jgi:hypothetical protein
VQKLGFDLIGCRCGPVLPASPIRSVDLPAASATGSHGVRLNVTVPTHGRRGCTQLNGGGIHMNRVMLAGSLPRGPKPALANWMPPALCEANFQIGIQTIMAIGADNSMGLYNLVRDPRYVGASGTRRNALQGETPWRA